MNNHWISEATARHKGSLRATLGVKKGQRIGKRRLQAAAKSGSPITKRRARLAETLASFKH